MDANGVANALVLPHLPAHGLLQMAVRKGPCRWWAKAAYCWPDGRPT